MEVRLHELLVKVHFGEHARSGWVKDNVHVVEAARDLASSGAEGDLDVPCDLLQSARDFSTSYGWHGVTRRTHVLVAPEMVQKAELTQASLGQDLRVISWALRGAQRGSNELHTFLVNTFVTFLTAQVSPVTECFAEETHLVGIVSESSFVLCGCRQDSFVLTRTLPVPAP